MRGWQAKKRRTCALPVDKGYARKCKTTRSAGGYLFWLENIGSYHWGLMQGYSQTYEPWGGYFIRQQNGENLDLTKWQHDIYRFNGLPYVPQEIEVFRRFAKLADLRGNR